MADTPSCALYAGLKSLGRINNGNAAQILMAGNALTVDASSPNA